MAADNLKPYQSNSPPNARRVRIYLAAMPNDVR